MSRMSVVVYVVWWQMSGLHRDAWLAATSTLTTAIQSRSGKLPVQPSSAANRPARTSHLVAPLLTGISRSHFVLARSPALAAVHTLG